MKFLKTVTLHYLISLWKINARYILVQSSENVNKYTSHGLMCKANAYTLHSSLPLQDLSEVNMSSKQIKIWCGRLGKVSEGEGSVDRKPEKIILTKILFTFLFYKFSYSRTCSELPGSWLECIKHRCFTSDFINLWKLVLPFSWYVHFCSDILFWQ